MNTVKRGKQCSCNFYALSDAKLKSSSDAGLFYLLLPAVCISNSACSFQREVPITPYLMTNDSLDMFDLDGNHSDVPNITTYIFSDLRNDPHYIM